MTRLQTDLTQINGGKEELLFEELLAEVLHQGNAHVEIDQPQSGARSLGKVGDDLVCDRFPLLGPPVGSKEATQSRARSLLHHRFGLRT